MPKPTLTPEQIAALADSLDLSVSAISEPVFRPYMIDTNYRESLFNGVPESVKNYARTLRDRHGWKFYPVNQKRGRCYYGVRIITIPTWAIDRDSNGNHPGYKTWYISHELAHAYDEARSNHGDSFMAWLKKICPPEFVHYELDYKPRNAARNGISLPSSVQDDDGWLL